MPRATLAPRAMLGVAVVAAVLTACQAATPGVPGAAAPAARAPASELAAEAWADDTLDAAKLLAAGQELYRRDPKPKTSLDYCRDGTSLIDRGELRLGFREKLKALFRARVDRDPQLAAECARGLALGYSFAGRLDHAEHWANEALGHLGPTPSSQLERWQSVWASAYKIKGDAAARRGQPADAVTLYETALRQAPAAQRPWIEVAVANVAIGQRRFDEAATRLARAGTDAPPALHPVIGRAHGRLLLAKGETAEARVHFEAAVKAARTARNQYDALWALHGLARAHIALGDTPAALTAYRGALDAGERLREQFRSEEFRSGFYADVQDVFDEAVGLAASAGRVAEAFAMSERSRARSLLDIVRGRLKLAEGATTFVSVGARPASLAAIRGALPPDTALVVYHTLPERTLAWVVRSDAISGVTLPLGRAALEKAVRDLRREIIGRTGNAEAPARALHAALVAPLGLRPAEPIVVVPHGPLHYVPFAALRGPEGWLIEERPVASAPSASALAGLLGLAGIPLDGRGLALGNPELGDPTLRLPGAEQEVRRLAALRPGTDVYTRREATRARLLADAPASRLVHVAAHATIDAIDPLYSVIKLAGEQGASGDLEAHEIYRLDLSATRLVVLSACDSGMGRVARGDEFLGFQRVLLGAGVRSLVLTLWPIADAATADLMDAFYRHLPREGAGGALRLAQLELLRSAELRDPYLWAAFSLVGDWR